VPPPVEQASPPPAPDATSTYVPGCWIYRESRYDWRPGFWLAYRPGWVWSPAHYVWTPGGCVFVEGYWDRPLEDRGLLFAPVRFTRPVWTTVSFSWCPQFVVQTDFLLGSLFVCRPAAHYYFGDYFEARYERSGFVPWCNYRVDRIAYDPCFSYYRCTYAGDRPWERNLREFYAARFSGAIPRPPRTLIQQTQVVNNLTINRIQNVTVNKNIHITNVENVTALRPLTQVNNVRITRLATLGSTGAIRDVAVHNKVVKLERVSSTQLIQHQQTASQLRTVAQQRSQAESSRVAQGWVPKRTGGAAHTITRDPPKGPNVPPIPGTKVKAPAPVTPKPPDRPIAPSGPARTPAIPSKAPPVEPATPPAHRVPVTPPATHHVTPPVLPTRKTPPSHVAVPTPAPQVTTPPPAPRVTLPPTAPRVTSPAMNRTPPPPVHHAAPPQAPRTSPPAKTPPPPRTAKETGPSRPATHR
jgi:hypothetical protein